VSNMSNTSQHAWVDTVTKKPDRLASPPEINEKELESDLTFARVWFLVHDEHRSDKSRRKQRLCLQLVIKRAKSLKQACLQNRAPLPIDLEAPEIYLEKLKTWAEHQLQPVPRSPIDIEWGQRLADSIGIGRLSAFEWLAGEHLPKIYEKHFGEPATLGRTSRGEPNTRYVRFAVDALKKLGIARSDGRPYAPESILKAMTLARKGVPRRRVAKPIEKN
jgi:hypothetical protein